MLPSGVFKVVFIGSGGAIPRKGRDLPGILIEVDRFRILIDPSEGSVRRLMEIGVSPLKLTHILITHIHADHINGIPGLLATASMLNKVTPLTIAGPPNAVEFVKLFTPSSLPFRLNLVSLRGGDEPLTVEDLGNVQIQYISTYHTVDSVAYSIVLKRPLGRFNPVKAKELGVPVALWKRLQMGEEVEVNGTVIKPADVLDEVKYGPIKVTYTGDTMPGPNIVKLAKDSSILIHDSTYLPGESSEAGIRGHSTCIDAANDARESGVEILVLYHMSYRYNDDEYWSFIKCASAIFPRTLAAYDGLILEI